MASVDPKLIQAIRTRKQSEELLKKSGERKALREKLLELSGFKERGIDPSKMEISDEYLVELMAKVEELEKTEKLFEEKEIKADDPLRIKASKRQAI
jgi:hypothetical protein